MRNWILKPRSFLPLTLNCIALFGFISAQNETVPSRSLISRFDVHREPRFISFNSDENKIGIDLDMSIPFLTIPLNKDDPSNKELVNINPKALLVVGLLTIFTTFVVPFFVKPHPELSETYERSDKSSEWWQFGEVVNEAFLRNSHIVPCTQKIICSLVSRASHAKHPTSTDKIIDGISSHRWFEQLMGTAIQDAVIAGHRLNRNCAHLYPGCFLGAAFFDNLSDVTTGLGGD